jgi:hypothetical protein
VVSSSTPAKGAFGAAVHVGPLVIVKPREATGAINTIAKIANSRARIGRREDGGRSVSLFSDPCDLRRIHVADTRRENGPEGFEVNCFFEPSVSHLPAESTLPQSDECPLMR